MPEMKNPRAGAGGARVGDGLAGQQGDLDPTGTGAQGGAPLPFDRVADDLKQADRWLLWRSEVEEGRPKPRKLPYYVNGRRRGATDTPEDLASLATFDAVVAAFKEDGWDGIGFALGQDGDGFWHGIDLDDRSKHPELSDIELPVSYIELSPSGDGLHAIGYGRAFQTLGSNGTGIEAYSRGRFFTVTGHRVGLGGARNCLAAFVDDVLAPRHSPGRATTSAASEDRPAPSSNPHTLAAELADALRCIPADDRDLWIRIGIALKSVPDEIGRPLFMEWSATSDRHRPEADEDTWGRLPANPTGTGYRAIFAEAQRQGWENPGHARKSGPAKPLPIIRASGFKDRPIKPREWVVPGLVPAATTTTIDGDGGLGKSTLALQLCVAVALGGVDWLGRPVTRGRALYLSAEDDEDELQRRIGKICAHYECDVGELTDFALVPLADLDVATELFRPGEKASDRNTLVHTPTWSSLVATIKEVQPTLIILDARADVFGGDEINRLQVRQFMTALRKLAQTNSAAVVMLAHPSLTGMANGSGSSGSTAWNNSVRSRLVMSLPTRPGRDDEPPDPAVRLLSLKKSNYGPAEGDLTLRLNNQVFELDLEATRAADRRQSPEEHARIDRLFMTLLSKCSAQGNDVMVGESSARFAPKVFAKEESAKGLTKRAFEQAMRRLLDGGMIRVEERGPPSKRQRFLVATGTSDLFAGGAG